MGKFVCPGCGAQPEVTDINRHMDRCEEFKQYCKTLPPETVAEIDRTKVEREKYLKGEA
jgi:hypothetical protein